MSTFPDNITNQVHAVDVALQDNMLRISLSDGRGINLPIDRVEWLSWLARATPEQQANWSIEPRGFAIYWKDLDDGIEISHLLSTQPLA
jgi:hypothetical protein